MQHDVEVVGHDPRRLGEPDDGRGTSLWSRLTIAATSSEIAFVWRAFLPVAITKKSV